jgi:hypothetical protein
MLKLAITGRKRKQDGTNGHNGKDFYTIVKRRKNNFSAFLFYVRHKVFYFYTLKSKNSKKWE